MRWKRHDHRADKRRDGHAINVRTVQRNLFQKIVRRQKQLQISDEKDGTSDAQRQMREKHSDRRKQSHAKKEGTSDDERQPVDNSRLPQEARSEEHTSELQS